MTKKQEKILAAALKLFAENGFDSTSTNKVAKEAGVSEGLIFRHYKNKEGLLEAVLEQGGQVAEEMYAQILSQPKPKDVVRGVIELPFGVDEETFDYWKLIYALKWRTDIYDDSMSRPIRNALVKAFGELGYNDPQAEAEVIMLMIDGIATMMLLRRPEKQEAILQTILNKYEL